MVLHQTRSFASALDRVRVRDQEVLGPDFVAALDDCIETINGGIDVYVVGGMARTREEEAGRKSDRRAENMGLQIAITATRDFARVLRTDAPDAVKLSFVTTLIFNTLMARTPDHGDESNL